jgi:cytochrome c oxidase cbb3-type subunit 3
MTSFWSGWVVVLAVLNLGIAVFLFVWALRLRIPTQPDGTTGHVWAHGVLREGVRNLPIWWIVISICVLLGCFTYLALYPGLGGFKGLLGWTSQSEHQQAATKSEAKIAATLEPLRTLSIEQIAANAQTAPLGHRLYLDNCAACHGTTALGNQLLGAPNLTDDDHLYGSGVDDFLTSVRNGRRGTMPAWGEVLVGDGVKQVTAYVLSLSGTDAPADWVQAGKTHYDQLCVACHAADGRGNPGLGVPNLVDSIWLYGGDFGSIAASIRNGRGGVMPAWRDRLSEDEIRVITAWVYSQRPSAALAKN